MSELDGIRYYSEIGWPHTTVVDVEGEDETRTFRRYTVKVHDPGLSGAAERIYEGKLVELWALVLEKDAGVFGACERARWVPAMPSRSAFGLSDRRYRGRTAEP